MMSDPISEMLARIRNANLRRHSEVSVSYSKMKESILKVMQVEGFLANFLTEGQGTEKQLKIALKYGAKGESLIRSLRRISKPGRRIRKGYKDLKPILNSQGILVVSTSRGVISDGTCREIKIGGEVLLEVY